MLFEIDAVRETFASPVRFCISQMQMLLNQIIYRKKIDMNLTSTFVQTLPHLYQYLGFLLLNLLNV